MALERCVALSEERDKPGYEAFFRMNKLGAMDVKTLAEDQPKEARTMLDLVLCGPRASLGLEELRRVGGISYFDHVDPIIGFGGGSQGHKDLWEHTKTVVEQAIQKPAIRWAALFHDVGKVRTFSRDGKKVSFHGHETLGSRMFWHFATKDRLFLKDEAERIGGIILHLGRVESFEGEWTDSAVRRLMVDLGDRLEDVLALSSADITTGRDSKRQAILRNIASLSARIETVRAEEAMPRLPKGLGIALATELGIPMSKELGNVIKGLERRLRSGEIGPCTDIAGYVEMVRKERE